MIYKKLYSLLAQSGLEFRPAREQESKNVRLDSDFDFYIKSRDIKKWETYLKSQKTLHLLLHVKRSYVSTFYFECDGIYLQADLEFNVQWWGIEIFNNSILFDSRRFLEVDQAARLLRRFLWGGDIVDVKVDSGVLPPRVYTIIEEVKTKRRSNENGRKSVRREYLKIDIKKRGVRVFLDFLQFFYAEILILLKPQGVLVSNQEYEQRIKPNQLKLVNYRTPLTGIEQPLSNTSTLQLIKYLRDGRVVVSDHSRHIKLRVLLSYLGYERGRYRNKYHGVF